MIWPARVCAIEITPTEVKAALVRQRGQSCKVLALAEQAIERVEDEDPRESAIRALESVLDDNDLSADVYVGCLPANVAIFRPLTIPFVGSRRVGAAVKYAMEPVVPFPIDDLMVDHMYIRQNGKQSTDVLAVGLRTETVRFHLEVLEGAGLDPDSLGLDVAGLTNLWRTTLTRTAEQEGDMSLVVHVRKDCSYFVVTDKGAPVFLRAMNFGAAALREGQMITMEEMLATVRSVMTTFDRESFGEILVTGVDLDHSVIDQLAERLGLAVRCVRLSKNSRFHAWRKRVEPTGDADENRWEPLIGLAADGGQKSYMRLNLRREELAQLLLTPEIRRRAMFSGALLAVLALAGVLGLNVQLHELGAEADQLDDAIYEVYKEAVPDGALPKGYDVLAAMEQQIDQESTDRIVSPFLGKTLPAIEVLSAVSGCVPPGDTVDITRLEMLLGGTVRLSGLTTDPTVPGKVKEKLAALECLVNVDINQRQDVVKSGVRKVEFSVSGELKPTS